MNNKRVEAEARKIFGKDIFLKRKSGIWYICERIRPDSSKAIGCCCRGNRTIGSGSSPREALQNAKNCRKTHLHLLRKPNMKFFLGVVVNKENPTAEEINYLMEPYSDDLEVPEYEVECDCIGEVARCHADIISKRFRKQGKSSEIWIREYNSHWLKDEPKKDCDSCNSSGITTSTENPNGKWYWFKVGGRWDGVIGEKHTPDLNITLTQQAIKNNIISIEKYVNILEQTRYKSIILGDKFNSILLQRNWVEVRRFSRRKLIELLLPYKDKWIIGLDCESI